MIRHNLSIFSFRSGKKICRRVFLVLAVVLLFLIGNKVLNYLYQAEEDWGRILWHNYYGQTENIDYIYLGTSHVYCDINPEVLDERNGKNNFNMAMSGERLIDSYYLLKEAGRQNKIEKVYLELYYVSSTGVPGNYQEKSSLQTGWRCMDYMEPSFYKAEAILLMNPIQYYPEAFFPFIRYREHLMDGNWIKGRVDYKKTEDYINYIHNDGTTEYRDKGYYYTTRELANFLYERGRKPEEMHLTEDAEIYLRKIITYCQERQIQITLFSSPIYEIQCISTENYDSYAEQIEEIAAEYGVPYYDFNMVKEEHLSIQNPEYFMDVNHLNGKGAEMYTNFFYKVVSAQPEDNKKYFYDSYEEKLRKEEQRVYGLYCYDAKEADLQEGDEPGKTKRMVIASNRETELEYRVLFTADNEETVILQDFSTNKKFNIGTEEYGIFEIIWRSAKDGKEAGSMGIRYG